MKTVVYIDDEEAVCRAIELSLEDSPVEVRTFCDPRAALEYINQEPPALVICDFRMPELSGLEVLERMEVDVPFVLISGYLKLEVPEHPRLVQVLAKPVSPEALVELVESYTGR